MNGLHSPFLEKVITTDYRFCSQDKWTDPKQTRLWNAEDYLDDIARGHDDIFCGEDKFSEQHKTFTPQKLKQLKKILHDDEQICDSIIELPVISSKCPTTTIANAKEIVYTEKTNDEIIQISIDVYDEIEDTDDEESLEDLTETVDGPVQHVNRPNPTLNSEQQEIFDVYANYLEHPQETSVEPPSIVLVSGKGGTGKSHLINSIIAHGEKCKNPPVRAAYNNLNAANIGGVTIASLLKDGFETIKGKVPAKKRHSKHIKQSAVAALQKLFPVDKLLLFIIDEILNVSVEHLA